MAALEDLKQQLTRRFTDRKNVDFGMSRVIRDGARMHYAPLAEKLPARDEMVKSRESADGKPEVLVDKTWISSDKLRATMRPENAVEKRAIDELKNGEVYTAIYTVGRFGFDNNEAPTATAESGYLDSYYGKPDNMGVRVKGPAYLTQTEPVAPRAFQVVDFGRKAWASGAVDFDAPGPDGWHFFAHRIQAVDQSCISCHSAGSDNPSLHAKPSVMKLGDGLGIFVVALKLKSAKVH
jgi:hypothetical protein